MRTPILVVAILGIPLFGPAWLPAQSFRRGGAEFNALREVTVPPDKDHGIVVVQFFHHGEIKPDGKNVAVAAREDLVPCRILQLGPGDYCRLAFQTIRGQKIYEVLYGGDAAPETPEWTNKDGLLLETRVYKDCNLNGLESVRDAFRAARPIGADYVENVHHACNPFAEKPGPFFSRYSGSLMITTGGKYGFFTSSRDCSFLLIDDKLVVEAPGAHGPTYDTHPGTRKDIQLSAGRHKFEYYHAAAGSDAMMTAAWEPNPGDPAKAKAQAIPPESFHAAAASHLLPGPASTRAVKLVPDFLLEVAGDVPLPDNDVHLVGVRFRDTTPKALTMKGKLSWDFGDGQTYEGESPVHVYLHSGLYTVTLTVKLGSKPYNMTNRVAIDPPLIFPKESEKLHTLDDYLPTLRTYNPKTLDSQSVRQLVAAYQAKIDAILTLTPEEEAAAAGLAPPEEKKDDAAEARHKEAKHESLAKKRAEAMKYYELAVAAGKAAFEEDSAAKGEADLYPLALSVGAMARDHLGKSLLAAQVYVAASGKIQKPEWRAECEIEAADIAVNDLGNEKGALTMLEAASKRIDVAFSGTVPARLKRVWGDYYAMTGKGDEARKAYHVAEEINANKTLAERTAWQGAHSRSTEQFLKTKELDRAIAEIRAWQSDFPGEKVEGYLTYLYARYWAARELYPQAIALSEQLFTVNKDSPYIDVMLALSAKCDVKRGKVDGAVATLSSLVKNYPGSPTVPAIKEALKRLQSGESDPALLLLDAVENGNYKEVLENIDRPAKKPVRTRRS
jgi:TolA-binding protein/chitodextrinase